MELAPPLATLYRTHFRFVWASLRALGVPEASLEDALQDVFIVVHRRLPDFQGRSSVRTWIFAIARRVAFRHRRGRARADRRARALLGEHEVTPPAEPEPGDRVLGQSVLRALDELDDDKRTAIVLHVLHEMSGPEIAELLAINVDTAYSRIKAARTTLRRRLGRVDAMGDPRAMGRALRSATRPPQRADRRGWALLATRLGLAGSGATAATTAATTASLPAILGAIAIAAVAVLSTSVIATDPSPPAREPSAQRSVVPAGAAASAPVAQPAKPEPAAEPLVEAPNTRAGPIAAAPRPAPARTRATAPSAPARAAAPQPLVHGDDAPPLTADRLVEEVALVDRARRALDGGQPAVALAVLRDHATQFSAGQLAREREAYRAIAECESGRSETGQARAREVARTEVAASLAVRVREACDLS